MKQDWKKIKGFDNYEINSDGVIKRLAHKVFYIDGRIRNQKEAFIGNKKPSPTGYYMVSLSQDKKIHVLLVHRLLATAFIPNPENKREVNHINAIKSDNSLENLEWVTPKENMQHAKRLGLITRNPPKAKEHYKSITVFDTLTGIFYDCISDAAKTVNTRPQHISRKLNGTRKNNTKFIYA